MQKLACPKCGSENIIHAKVSADVWSAYGICRDCWHKGKIEKFIDAYEINHDADGEPEYVPGEDKEEELW